MNDEGLERQRQRVLDVDNRWRVLLGLDRYWITYRYPRTPSERDEKDWRVLFTCDPHWEYCEATIDCYVEAIERVSDDDLERLLLHEFCHIFVEEMRDSIDQRHEERVVTMLSEAFQKVREAGEKEGFARLGGTEGAD